MTYFITVRATGFGHGVLPTVTKGHCHICGEEVHISSSSRRLLRNYSVRVICTACIAQKGGLMAHKRLFDPKFFNKPKTIQLCLKEKYLYLAMKAHADDDGRLIGHPAYLQTIAFLYDNISISRIRAFRDHVIEVDPENLGLMLYKNNEAEYIVFRKFKEEQKPKHYAPSELPPPPDEEDPEGAVEENGGPVTGTGLAPDRPRNGSQKSPPAAPQNPQKGDVSGENSGPKRAQKGDISGDFSAPESSEKVPLGLGRGLGGELTHAHTSYSHSLTPRASHSEDAERKHASERESSGERNEAEGGDISGENGDPERENPPEKSLRNVAKTKHTKKRLKPHQKSAGLFLDSVEKRKNIQLLQREKLLHIVRKLFWIEGTTPEKLLRCFFWLEEHDSFCRGKEPPLIIAKMPDKYPSWLQGKLLKYEPKENQRRSNGEPGKDSAKAGRKPLEPIESGPDDEQSPEPAGGADGGNDLSHVPQDVSGSDKDLHDPGENQRDPPA